MGDFSKDIYAIHVKALLVSEIKAITAKLIIEAMRNVKMEAGSSVDLLSDSIAINPGTGRVIFQSERLS